MPGRPGVIWFALLALTAGCFGSLTPIEPEDACRDAEYAFAGRVLECTGDQDVALRRYRALREKYGCIITSEDRIQTAYSCSAGMSQIPCDLIDRYGEDLGMLFSNTQVNACQGVFGAGTIPDQPQAACDAVFATVKTALGACAWSTADVDSYVAHLRKYLSCNAGFSVEAYHTCVHAAESTGCESTSVIEAGTLAGKCPGVLQMADMDLCTKMRAEASGFLESSCSVTPAAADKALEDLLGAYSCRSEDAQLSPVSCGQYFTCPAVDMQDLESVVRKAMKSQVCKELLEPCSLLALEIDNLVFSCTGHETLASQVGAEFLAAFQCAPSLAWSTVDDCVAKVGCAAGEDASAWLTAFRALNESQDGYGQCYHVVSDKPPAPADAGVADGGGE